MCINTFPVTCIGMLFFKCHNVPEEEMPEPYNSNQARFFWKTSLSKIKVNDLAVEYNIQYNLYREKHTNKYLKEAG